MWTAIAETAREYVWSNGVHPKDALHVATAIDAKVKQVQTFDEGLLKKSGRIEDGTLHIEKPSWEAPKLPMDMPKVEKKS